MRDLIRDMSRLDLYLFQAWQLYVQDFKTPPMQLSNADLHD